MQQNLADAKNILRELCQQSEEAIFDDRDAYKSFFEVNRTEIEEESSEDAQVEEEASNHFNSTFKGVEVNSEHLEDVYEDS